MKKHVPVIGLIQLCAAICMLVTLYSCSPKARFTHLTRRHPELISHDTTTGTVNDTIKKVDVKLTAAKDTSTIKVDSILHAFQDARDVAYFKNIGNELRIQQLMDSINRLQSASIKKYIATKPILKDTVTKIQDDVTVKVFNQGGGIGISIYRPEKVNKLKTLTVINTAHVEKCELPWWVKLVVGALIVSLILNIFLLAYSKLRK